MNFLLIYGGSAKTLQYKILSDFGIFIPWMRQSRRWPASFRPTWAWQSGRSDRSQR
jgi:hypothetical protein